MIKIDDKKNAIFFITPIGGGSGAAFVCMCGWCARTPPTQCEVCGIKLALRGIKIEQNEDETPFESLISVEYLALCGSRAEQRRMWMGQSIEGSRHVKNIAQAWRVYWNEKTNPAVCWISDAPKIPS